MRPGVAADGREATKVLSMQTDGQLKSIREGGFSLQHHGKMRFPSFTAVNVSATKTRKRRLLFQRSGHARHTLLLPSGERPGGSFH